MTLTQRSQPYRSRKWLAVPGYEGIYEVGDMGEVRSLARLDSRGSKRPEKLIKPFRDGDKGYMAVCLTKGGVSTRFKLHRLVATVWHGAPEHGQQVNHLNGDKKDNAPANLAWCSGAENIQHAYRKLGKKSSGGHKGKTGAKHHASRPVVAKNLDSGEETRYESAADAARHIGIPAGSIPRCCNGHYRSSHGFSFRYEDDRNA
ncbi:NUMOD4 domain-containing protein [Pseudomonas aeruginosa]